MSVDLSVNPLREGLARERVVDPCIFVIFGGTGDLARKKLVPALYHLYRAGELPRAFAIVGCASSKLDDDQYRDWVRDAVTAEAPYLPTSGPDWESFVKPIYYVDRFGDPPYSKLKDRLAEIDSKVGAGGNYLFYLAIPPSAFEDTAEQTWARWVLPRTTRLAAAGRRKAVRDRPRVGEGAQLGPAAFV